MSGLVTADDLRRWADMATAPSMLPELIARLVMATAHDRVQEVRFPSGKGTSLGGWDGRTVTTAPGLFVPEGITVWELGTEQNPGAKAQDDYNKRKADPLGVQPQTVTYAAVTPRAWEARDTWQDSCSNEQVWKDVRAFDAHSLYAWLLDAPAVHYWLSSQIGLGTLPTGVSGVEGWWEPWAGSARVELSTGLVHAGHLQQAQRLRQRLADGTHGVVGVRWESRHEALAFVAATVMHRQPAPDEIMREDVELAARALVVESADSFRELTRTQSPLILIPTFEDRDLVDAAARRHLVVLPFGSADREEEVFLDLGPVDPREFEAPLRELGLEVNEAAELARDSRGRLLALRRAMQTRRNHGPVEWAQPEIGNRLAPIALLTSWDEGRPADKEIVAAVTRRDYGNVHDMLTPLLYGWEPPVAKAGTVWEFAVPRDAWMLLHRYLADADLSVFAEQAAHVLRLPDPRYSLPPERRYAGAAYGAVPVHSDVLRTGLATTVAVLGAVGGPTTFDSSTSAQDWATRIVGDVLDGAAWETWASLDHLLGLLAEASPDAFLRATDRGLRDDAPLRALLQSDVPGFFGGATHVGLVWSLERLAWSPQHAPRSALALARLAELDPGGRTLPRPRDALVALLSPQGRPSTMPTERAIEILDLLRQRHPAAAWDTMITGLSGDTTHSIGDSQPVYRRWVREAQESTG